MDLNPKHSQPPDSSRYSQKPNDPQLARICQRQGCGGNVDPATGTCRRCGQRHLKIKQQSGQWNVPPHKSVPQNQFTPEDTNPAIPETTKYGGEPHPLDSRYGGVTSQYPLSGSTLTKDSPSAQYTGTGYSDFVRDSFWGKIRDWAKELPGTAAFWWAMRGVVILLFGFTGFWVYHNIDWFSAATINPDPSPNTALIPSTIQSQLQTYDLTVNVGDPKVGSVSINPNETSYKSGASVTLSAQPASGYIFDRWSGDVDITDTSDTVTVVMDSNKEVTAYFKVIDTTSPEIYDIHVVKYSDITATIAWKASEKTSGYVKYKRGDTGEYIDSVPSASDATDNHMVKLTGLRPNGTYYYIIELTDTSGNTTTSKTQALSTLPPIKEGHEEGKRAPNLVLTPYEHYGELPITNGTLELTEFLGKKKLYINFWSTYCAPCIVEFPVLQTIYEKPEYYQGWEMITICIDGRDDRIVKLKEKYPELQLITLPTLFYAEGTDQNAYHIWKVPTSFFIDEEGIIRYVKLGRFYNTQEFKDALDSIL